MDYDDDDGILTIRIKKERTKNINSIFIYAMILFIVCNLFIIIYLNPNIIDI